MKTLKVGGEGFFKGKVYRIIGGTAKQWILMYEDGKNSFAARKSEVEPVASVVFKLRDRVRSEHWFQGTVTGFEPENNRVVCISDKIVAASGDRTRYAYKPTEIHHMVPESGRVFELDALYNIANWGGADLIVRAKQYRSDAPEWVVLCESKTDIPLIVIHRDTSLDELELNGIFGVRSIN